MARRFAVLLQALNLLAAFWLAGKVFRGGGLSTGALIVGGVFAGFGILAGLAGLGLWRGMRSGAILAVLTQSLQVLHLHTSALIYTLSLPFSAAVGYGDGQLHWAGAWRPAIEITFDSEPASAWVGLNLIAAAGIVAAIVAVRRPK